MFWVVNDRVKSLLLVVETIPVHYTGACKHIVHRCLISRTLNSEGCSELAFGVAGISWCGLLLHMYLLVTHLQKAVSQSSACFLFFFFKSKQWLISKSVSKIFKPRIRLPTLRMKPQAFFNCSRREVSSDIWSEVPVDVLLTLLSLQKGVFLGGTLWNIR